MSGLQASQGLIHGIWTWSSQLKLFGVLSLCFQLQKMKEKKGLYPDKSVYTQQIGPGFCFGALALMLRFFFEVTFRTLKPTDFARCSRHYQARRFPLALRVCIQLWTNVSSGSCAGLCRTPPSPCPPQPLLRVLRSGWGSRVLSSFSP